MAPALSDAARQSVHSGFRLPPSPPPSESSPETDRERDCESPSPSERAASPVQRTLALPRPRNGFGLVTEASIPAFLEKQLLATANSLGCLNTMNINQQKANGFQTATGNLNGHNSNNNSKKEMAGQGDVLDESSKPVTNRLAGETQPYTQIDSGLSASGNDNGMDTDDQSDLTILKSLVSDRSADASKRQVYLERRSERLLQRVRRLQVKQTNDHVRDQLVAFVQHQRKNLQSCVRTTTKTTCTPTNTDFHAELLQSEDVKNLSTAALVNLVRKLESAHGSQLRQRLTYTKSGHVDEQVVVALGDNLCNEISFVSSSLGSNLNHLERVVDSEATDSSSGGESCDEDEFDYSQTQHVQL